MAAKIDPLLKKMFNGYREAALWASTDDDGEPLDERFSVSDFSSEANATMLKDCADFLADNADDIAEFQENTSRSLEDVGHDFFLTRNGHGVGFWDRTGGGAAGQRLSKASEKAGTQDVYVGDDEELHVTGGGVHVFFNETRGSLVRRNPTVSNPRSAGVAVTMKNLLKYFKSGRRTALSAADAALLVEACRPSPSHERANEALDLANSLLGGFGIESIGGKYVGPYYQNTVGLYVNMGDTYDSTILYDTIKRKFYVTSVGDFVEVRGRAYQVA